MCPELRSRAFLQINNFSAISFYVTREGLISSLFNLEYLPTYQPARKNLPSSVNICIGEEIRKMAVSSPLL